MIPITKQINTDRTGVCMEAVQGLGYIKRIASVEKTVNPAFPQKPDNTGSKALHHPLPNIPLPFLLTDASWHTWTFS